MVGHALHIWLIQFQYHPTLRGGLGGPVNEIFLRRGVHPPENPENPQKYFSSISGKHRLEDEINTVTRQPLFPSHSCLLCLHGIFRGVGWILRYFS